MTAKQTAQDAVHAILGDTARAEIQEFPGGNLSLTIHSGAHSATIDGHPDTGWGWTVDPGEDDGFTGHEETAPTLEDALCAVRDAVARGQ
ncbi:hypothetical protein ACIQGZ_15490 [Streptomyces sp. NPDC092296]|uniref:hypothetical protein n=1 Tax=Streptomyces sp. NPDC092296 TaxID=3366012 RepID=UPI0038300CD5